MFQVSNVEFILLTLIYEKQKITGYQLNSLIEERGYREWADIGTTSIYTGLKKLKERNCVNSATDRYKKGKGPKGTNYKLTPDGLTLLKTEVEQGLSTTRERDRRFALAVSALDVLSFAEILDALARRKEYLQQEFERIYQRYDLQKEYLPLSAELLFRHTFTSIKKEIVFIEESITLINSESPETNFREHFDAS